MILSQHLNLDGSIFLCDLSGTPGLVRQTVTDISDKESEVCLVYMLPRVGYEYRVTWIKVKLEEREEGPGADHHLPVPVRINQDHP